jgi:hypothetical protein
LRRDPEAAALRDGTGSNQQGHREQPGTNLHGDLLGRSSEAVDLIDPAGCIGRAGAELADFSDCTE